MEHEKIRLLVVDDSALFRSVLTTRLSDDSEIDVVGYAIDAADAFRQIDRLNPDVITLDVEMPKMSGIEMLKLLLPKRPLPVIIVSNLNISVFDALSAGAIDFVRKPAGGGREAIDAFISELSTKIKNGLRAKVKPRQSDAAELKHARYPLVLPKAAGNHSIIAIGASTGGTEATLTLVRGFDATTPGMVVVQHMPPGFTKLYADRLNGICKMEVKEAADGDEVRPGRMLIAPGDKHMKIEKRAASNFIVRCFDGEKVSGHRPSVDVLFESVAEHAKANAIGVILTGMGRDGASGLLKMRNAGAYTLGQDKDSCVVYGMPMVANEIGAVIDEAPLEHLPELICERLLRSVALKRD